VTNIAENILSEYSPNIHALFFRWLTKNLFLSNSFIFDIKLFQFSGFYSRVLVLFICLCFFWSLCFESISFFGLNHVLLIDVVRLIFIIVITVIAVAIGTGFLFHGVEDRAFELDIILLKAAFGYFDFLRGV